MARVTVEDCLEHVDNRFDLVLLATKRARQLVHGVEPLVPRENDKPTVIALREIAKGLITPATMEAAEAAATPEESFAESLEAEVESTQEAAASGETPPAAEGDQAE